MSRLHLLSALGLAATLVAMASAGEPAHATFPGRNGKIAFESERDGDLAIWSMNADGSGPAKLTNDPAEDFSPAWSPDGARIAFTSERDGNREIYVMNADGTNPVRLTNDGAQDFHSAWSPDGQTIAFRRGGEIWTMDPQGGNLQNLSNGHSTDTNPEYSPDGAKIVFASNEDGDFDILVMDADGGNRTKLTQGPPSDGDPSWSPDGTQILYGSFENGSSEVKVIASDGSGAPANLTNHAAYDSQPAWSPDGTKIAFYSDRDGGDGDVYLMDPSGANVQRLTTDMSSYDPDWQSLPLSIHGDIRCDGGVDATDALGILREVAGMPQIAQTEPCPDLGDNVDGRIFGDALCSGGIDAVDALAVLRFVAAFPPISAGPGCPVVGEFTSEPQPVSGTADVTMGDNFFEFNGIRNPIFRMTADDTVLMNLANQGLAIHNMRTAGADGHYSTQDDHMSDPMIISASSAATIEISFDHPGTYRYRCDFHPADMHGAIVVE